MRQTDNKTNTDVGLPDEKKFEEQVIDIDRVARVVKGGRRFRFRALVVVGDRKSKVGVGVSKGGDVQSAIGKAVEVAKKNMITVPIENETIPHDSQRKVGGANILLLPASKGTGLIAGGVVRVIVELGGVKNIMSKSIGSSNKINCAYATIEALEHLEPSSKWLNKPEYKKAEAKSDNTGK